ncbi:N-acetylmuramoyl-L-alanine amidase [Elusimicrobiota bacterium]
MQKKVVPIVVSLMLLLVPFLYAVNQMPVTVFKDGKKIRTIDMALINKMGYLKARDISEIFGGKLEFNKKAKTITLCFSAKNLNSSTVEFVIDSEYVVMDGIKRKMMKTPRIINSKTYIPLEVVLTMAFENLVGAQVSWDYSKKSLWVSYKGNISDIRHYSYDKYTRLVIEMTEDLHYKSDISINSIELDIKDAELSRPMNSYSVSNGVLGIIKIEQTAFGMKVRIPKEGNAGEEEIMKFPSPPRIVVDVKNIGEKTIEIDDMDKLPSAPAGPATKRTKTGNKEISLIVIDPGHGGKDPGAIGRRGTREKDIVLEIAKRVAKKIRKKLKIRAVLTRSSDRFVPLSERIRIANSKEADLFISIHNNASLKSSSRGFEVYFLSGEASDKEASAVANMENSVMAMEEDNEDKSRLSKILWSLTMNQFMNESSELCSFVDEIVTSRTGLINRGVKQAGFYVMKGARMPAILVEAGFLSNLKEEKQLNSSRFQNRIAESLTKAVEEYVKWVKKQ